MRNIYILGLVTLFVFGVFGALIIEFFQEKKFFNVLTAGWNWPLQLTTGIAYGLTSAFLAWLIISSDFFKKEREFYKQKFSQFDLGGWGNIIFLSLCAGIGEEIFFRAAIQPFLGIWPTAILFVLIHGYLNPFNLKISIYGIYMVVVMGGIGYLFETAGLITVMAAHTVIDIFLFKKMLSPEKKV